MKHRRPRSFFVADNSLSSNSPLKNWNRFLYQCLKDANLWIFFVLYLSLFRQVFIFLFRHNIDETSGWPEFLRTALFGLRYDVKVASVWIAAPFLLSALNGAVDLERITDRFRKIFGSIFVVLSTIACVLTIPYFREYHDQFNQFVFNVYYDDTRAIAATIWAAYHPLLNLAAIGLIIFGMRAVKDHYFSSSVLPRIRIAAYQPSVLLKIAIPVLLIILLAAGARGSFTNRPLKVHDAVATKDEFLNKAVFNPYISLLQAFSDKAKLAGGGGIDSFLPDRDVKKAAQSYFNAGGTFSDIDQYLKRTAQGPRNKPPRHVIVILMESYDAWPLAPKYASLGLTNNLKQLAAGGISVERFLPAGTWTVPAFCTIMTDLPYTVPLTYQESSRTTYPSALAATFRRLGYRTRLFYGGFLTWEKIGDLAKAQGFDESYGALHIKDKSALDAWGKEWGVDDEDLFDFALSHIDDSTPSFDFILTTTNHPPYRLDVKAKGFPLTVFPEALLPLVNAPVNLNVLGHLWYADRSLGDFVRKAETKFPSALFAMTGDHYGRKCISAKPDFFERSAVPFVLYGKDVLKNVSLPDGAAGSHIDISPTLIELAAPKGFPYYAMGHNLLEPQTGAVGRGYGKVIGKDYIADLSDSPALYPLPGKALPRERPDLGALKAMNSEFYGIGWWRVKQGSKL